MPLDTLTLTDIASGGQTGAATRTTGRVDAHAWQREMERAQTKDWFQGAVEYKQHRATTPSAATTTATSLHGEPVTAGTSSASAMSAAAQRVAIQSIRLGLGAEGSLMSAVGPGMGVGQAFPIAFDPVLPTVSGQQGATRQTSTAAAGREPDSGRDEMPMRLHVEVGESGARLWIGTAASTNEQVEQVVAEIRRRLAERGIALASVTCNGKPLQETLSGRAETTRPAPYSEEGIIYGIDR